MFPRLFLTELIQKEKSENSETIIAVHSQLFK